MNRDLIQLAQRKGVTLDPELTMATSSMSHGAMQSSSSTMRDHSTNAGVAKDHGAPRATGAAGTASTGASTGVATNASTATSGTGSGVSDASMSTSAGISTQLASDRDYRKLAKATGAEFDQEYVDMMVDQHENDVQLFEKTSKNAQDSEVRTFASTHLPALQGHLDRAKSLMRSVSE
jgi:hypothetical protein